MLLRKKTQNNYSWDERLKLLMFASHEWLISFVIITIVSCPEWNCEQLITTPLIVTIVTTSSLANHNWLGSNWNVTSRRPRSPPHFHPISPSWLSMPRSPLTAPNANVCLNADLAVLLPNTNSIRTRVRFRIQLNIHTPFAIRFKQTLVVIINSVGLPNWSQSAMATVEASSVSWWLYTMTTLAAAGRKHKAPNASRAVNVHLQTPRLETPRRKRTMNASVAASVAFPSFPSEMRAVCKWTEFRWPLRFTRPNAEHTTAMYIFLTEMLCVILVAPNW